MKFSVQTIADNIDYSNFSDLYPEYSNDIDDIDRSDDYYFSSRKKFEIFARNVIDLFDSFPDEFPVYRSIKVKSEQDIDMDDLGESWSFDLESARNFGYGNGSNIILSAIVTSDNIDWYESMHRYLIFSPGDFDDENEIVVRNTDWLKDLKISKIKEAVEVGKNPIFIRESLKSYESFVSEGVADIFLQKRHYFDTDFNDFEEDYKRQSLKDDKDIVVYDDKYEHSKLVIIKNPKTLKNISYKTRGIIDKDGNLYVQQFSTCTHMVMVNVLSKLNLIKYDYNWHKEMPKDFITVQRYNNTNIFYVGESNILYKDDDFYRDIYSIPDDFDIELYKCTFKEFLDRCSKNNPQYKFKNSIISDIDENSKYDDDLNEKYLDSNYPPLYHYNPYLEKILEDDILLKKSPYKGKDCICFTRNPQYTYEKNTFRRLKLDQNKLRLDGYVPKSIDEFSYLDDPWDRKLHYRGHAEWEFEERIYKDIKNLGKYIISIQIPTSDDYRGGIALNQTPLGILTYIKKYPRIKLEYYNINKRWNVTPISVPVEIVESSKKGM